MTTNDRITAVEADITTIRVDAIVNAANTSLLGGGGVDGAIHRAAGAELLEACKKIGGCPTGEARITPGFKLPAAWVIHTVGPIWNDGTRDEDKLLRSCYVNSLTLAARNKLKSVAFPSISTGAYRFPLDRAVPIAVDAVKSFLETEPAIERVLFVCFGRPVYERYVRELALTP